MREMAMEAAQRAISPLPGAPLPTGGGLVGLPQMGARPAGSLGGGPPTGPPPTGPPPTGPPPGQWAPSGPQRTGLPQLGPGAFPRNMSAPPGPGAPLAGGAEVSGKPQVPGAPGAPPNAGFVALPPVPTGRPAPSDWEQPTAKRSRVEPAPTQQSAPLLSEDEFARSIPEADHASITAIITGDRSAQKAFAPFKAAQTISLSNLALVDTVESLKQRICDATNIPVKKQKIRAESRGWLKDSFTLAHYNLAGTIELTLGSKERARSRRK